MTNIEVEFCREQHEQNTGRLSQNSSTPSRSSTPNQNSERRLEPVPMSEQASTGSPQPARASASSRMRACLGRSNGSSSRADQSRASLTSSRYNYNEYDDETSTVNSHFSDDTGVSAGSTYSERRRRKRKCAIRMMAVYLCLAGSVFLGVLMWRMGLIFQDVDDGLFAVRDFTNSEGYDELGRMVCNGLTLNCHRRANEIMYPTVHNAMSSREDSFLAYNNLYPLEDALMAGFRGLTLDSCDCSRVGIQLCHGLCLAGFRRPVDAFTSIVEFMKQNPHEVIVLELEVGDESLGPLFDELQQVDGLFDLMYQHPGREEKWPKLKDMIEMDERLIVFAHDDQACESGSCPDGVHPTFNYAFATPFSQRSSSELMNVEATCSVSRGWSNSDFVISNHFATNEQGLPDINVAAVTNAALNLQIRLDACQDKFSTKYGQEVINLLVVDFWNVGDVLDVVWKYNANLPAKTEAPSESPSLAPSVASPTSTVYVPVDDAPVTAAPSANQASGTPTNPPTDASSEVMVFAPTKSPTLEPSTAPSLTIESLFDSIMDDSENSEPTTAPLGKDATSNFTIPVTNNSTDLTIPSLGEDITIISSTSPSPTTGGDTTAAPSPVIGSNTSTTEASSAASVIETSTTTPLPTVEESTATSAPSLAPAKNITATTTSLPTINGSTYDTTPSPTFSPTDEEFVFDIDEEEPETPEATQAQVEKEQPLLSNDNLLSSAFGYSNETANPTLEDTIPPTTEDDEESHHVFVIEKDTSRTP